MYVVFHSNFAACIVYRRFKSCEFLEFVWTDCWGNKSNYVMTSPANCWYQCWREIWVYFEIPLDKKKCLVETRTKLVWLIPVAIVKYGLTGYSPPLEQSFFMQPSMGTLNSPSSRTVKDSTPSRRRIWRCKNFGIGESSPNLFFNMMNLYLVKFEAQWILNERMFYCFIILFIWKWILT